MVILWLYDCIILISEITTQNQRSKAAFESLFYPIFFFIFDFSLTDKNQ